MVTQSFLVYKGFFWVQLFSYFKPPFRLVFPFPLPYSFPRNLADSYKRTEGLWSACCPSLQWFLFQGDWSGLIPGVHKKMLFLSWHWPGMSSWSKRSLPEPLIKKHVQQWPHLSSPLSNPLILSGLPNLPSRAQGNFWIHLYVLIGHRELKELHPQVI